MRKEPDTTEKTDIAIDCWSFRRSIYIFSILFYLVYLPSTFLSLFSPLLFSLLFLLIQISSFSHSFFWFFFSRSTGQFSVILGVTILFPVFYFSSFLTFYFLVSLFFELFSFYLVIHFFFLFSFTCSFSCLYQFSCPVEFHS